MTQDAPTRRRILPPYRVQRDFLPPDMVAGLLAAAAENQDRFKPSTTGYGADDALRPETRISLLLRDFGLLRQEMGGLLRPLVPALIAELKVKPFEVSRLELELVAHNDGAFFARHIDTMRDTGERADGLRLLSGVYYFHAMPKAFEGGALRLHEIARDGDSPQFIDIQPEHNSLVFFPSWMPHEVMPVRCPSRRFMASRFAINCWFYGAKT